MWVFTNQGFVSIVALENNPSDFLIQSHFSHHIERLFPNAQVTEKPGATYRLRTSIQKHVVSRTLYNIVEGISYTDFKSSITDPPYLTICRDVWGTLDKYAAHPVAPTDLSGRIIP